MAGDEDQAQQVVADVVVERGVEIRVCVALLELELAADLARACARAAARGAARRSRGAWRWPSARRPGCPGRPTPATARARRPARPARAPRRAPTSRTMRARPAISLADSIRQTASIARWSSRRVTAHARTRGSGRVLLGCAGCCGSSCSAQLGRQLVAEVVGLEDLADLDLGSPSVGRDALDPLDRLVASTSPRDPEAGDQLLGLGERAVDDGALVAGEARPARPWSSGAGPRRPASRRP